ncbi:hypothetical protein RSOLAG22IIIB_11236 [Rhizoctonia solani]|uniref:Uncharacterized protein n=1 Tax=Rhizoctonia solani TaxID=456999 RepID=A0A0K6G7N7_9AGAM|nr:hypothetical protein RSOLAG22IIIB_11236 [Rhizoctonia solani]
MLSNLAAVLTTVFGVTFWLNGGNDAPADIISNSVVTTSSIDPSGTHVGDLTYYTPGLGACGRTNTPSDMIAAISHKLFDNYPGYDGTNPNNNPVQVASPIVYA